MYRLRTKEDINFSVNKEMPYEIHLISFESEEGFEKFMNNDDRKKYVHLKDESVKSVILMKGK
jgi:hypothetical protein